MRNVFKNLIIKPFAFLLILILILLVAGLISDITKEGTHFTRAVTSSKDAKLIKADYWGFMDPTIRFHFVATPKAIDDIIKDKGLGLVKNEGLRVYGLPKNEEWVLPPGEINSYKNKLEDSLDTTYVLQHNQQKDEAFYFIDMH